MKTGLRKIWRDLSARPLRTFLVTLAIWIGVIGVITMIGSGDIIYSQMQKDILEEELPMQQIFVTRFSTTPIEDPIGQLNELEAELQTQNTGFLYLEGRATYPLQWHKEGQDNFRGGYIRAFSRPYDQLKMDPARLLEGDFPRDGQKEVAIEIRMAERYELGVGDKLTFQILSIAPDADGNLTEETWTIVGIVSHPYADFTGGVLIPSTESVYFNYAEAQYVGGFSAFTAIFTRYETYEQALANTDNLVNTITERTSYIKTFDFKEPPSENSFLEFTRQYVAVLNALGIISVLVSGMLVFNVINSIVNEQKRQIGIMKSMGATTLELIGVYAGMSFAYGVLGTLPGVLMGILAANWLAHYVAPLANMYLGGFRISPLATGLGLALGLLTPMIGALIPVLLGTRVTILNALSDMGIASTYGKGLMARIIALLPVPISIRQALSNLWQKKGRLFLTGMTLTLAIAAFMGVSAVFGAVQELVENSFDTLNYEIKLAPNSPQELATVQTILQDEEDIRAIYGGIEQSITLTGYSDPQFQNDQLLAIGIRPDLEAVQLDLSEGKFWDETTRANGIILTNIVAKQLGVGVGDTVEVSISGEKHVLTVIGIDRYPFDLAYLDWETFGKLVSKSDEAKPDVFYLQLKGNEDDLTARAVTDSISDIMHQLAVSSTPGRMSNQVEIEEGNAQQFQVIGIVFNIASYVMALVGAIGLLITLSMAVFERQKEIGVMRSIGASSGTIVVQFLVEGLLVSLIAWVIAVPISFALSIGLVDTLPFGDLMEFKFPLIWLVYGLVASLGVATIASLWPSITAARKTVSEILRYQ